MLDARTLDAIDDAVDRGAEQAFELLARLVACPSTVGQEHGAIAVLDEELHSLGFSTRRVPIPDDIGNDPRAGVPPLVTGERYSLLGTRASDNPDGRSLLLNGHIDVVPADTPARWTTPPFAPARRGGRMYGRGAGDMKCGFAMGTLAIRSLLHAAPAALDGSLSFLAAVEEECTGNGTLASASAGVLADAVVVLEPTDLGIMLGGVGVLWCEVVVIGYSTHAQLAHLAVNPIDLALRLVEGLRGWADALALDFPDPGLDLGPSPYNLNVGGLSAGDWTSSAPTEATLRLRVGYPRGWSAERAETEVRTAVAAIVHKDGGFPELPLVRLSGFRAEGYLLDAEAPLVVAIEHAHIDAHGTVPRRFSLGSTTDARTYLNDFGVPALCYGPAAANIHGVDESVELATIVAGAKTLARFLADWFDE